MDNITQCYLNTISISKQDLAFQQKLKNKRRILKKHIMSQSKSVICQEDVVFIDITGQQSTLVLNQTGQIVQLKGGQNVQITTKNGKTQAQISTDKQLVKNLQAHKNTAKQLSPQQIKKLQQGSGESVFSSLLNGGVMLCDGIAYLIEGAGNILKWPVKALGTLLKPETKKYVQPYKDYKADLQKAMDSKGKEATYQQMAAVQHKNREFYQALQNAPDGVLLYDNVTKRGYIKHQGKFKCVMYTLPGFAGNPQGAKQSINAATQQAVKNGVPQGNGASNLTSRDGRYILANPQTAALFKNGCKKLKLRDKKSQGNFLEMIQKIFASMFGMENNEQDDYQEYTDSQRMSFSPFIRKIVKKGILAPGTYKFEYK